MTLSQETKDALAASMKAAGASEKEIAGMMLEIAVRETPDDAPAIYMIMCEGEYVNARFGQAEYMTDDIAKARKFPLEIAQALIPYLNIACDCGNAECEYPVAKVHTMAIVPNTLN